METKTLIDKANSIIMQKQREIEELRHFIIMCNKLQGDTKSVVVKTDNTENAEQNFIPTGHITNSNIKLKTKTQAAIDIALSRYQETGEPVPTRYILDEMQKQGYGINGQFPDSVIAGYLKSKNSLTAIRGKGWIPTLFS